MSDYATFLARGTFATILADRTAEVGDCLEWTGAYDHRAGVPIVKAHVDGRSVNLITARLVWLAAKGAVPKGRVVYRHCCNERCVVLQHLKLGHRGDQLRRRAELGLAGHLQSTRARMAQSARVRSTAKYSIEQADAVRDLAAAGVPTVLIAGATDVSIAMVQDIRRGRAWRSTAPVGSVFSWRPEACSS